MKKILILFIIFSFLFYFSDRIEAEPVSKTVLVTAAVPNSIAVGIASLRVNGPTMVAPLRIGMVSSGAPLLMAAAAASTVSSGVALSFDPLSFNSANQIWLPDHYFTIDVGPSGGPGSTDVVLSYAEGANPNAPGHGIGWKTTITFMKATIDGGGNTVETPLTGHGPKKMLIDLASEHITPAEITDQGWLRMYIGIVTKDPGAAFPDPANSEVFSNADHAGYYDGSLIVTATVS